MNARYHSTFTPSESDRGTLERLFVAREELASQVLERIVESVNSNDKHHRLLIGPRGIGKTHFVALVYHRVRAMPDLQERLWTAWLKEDPYIADYSVLLLDILRRLARENSLRDLEERLEGVLDLKGSDEKQVALEQLLLEYVGQRTLLLIVENLDDMLRDLGQDDRHKLRAFTQSRLPVTILATATSLVDAVRRRKGVFYGFFRVTPLKPLNVDQAVELLSKLAERAANANLIEALQSSMGYARIRAVHYLAGGNPRIYVLLSDFLNRESLDGLARPFMKLIDELTPYYQARMSRLAPLQRRIIDVLGRLRGASTVTEIARQAMKSQQSISAQLGKLKELGYVEQVASQGRSNYYELREPLMRMCLQIKEQQGRTVELFVQFLRVWYSETELDQLASVGSGDLERAHIYEAAKRAKSEQDPLQASLSKEFLRHQTIGNHEQALRAAEVAIDRTPGLKENWRRKAVCLETLGRGIEEQLYCWQRVSEIDPRDVRAWNSQRTILWKMGRYEDAQNASRSALDLEPENPALLRNLGYDLRAVGKEKEAREYFQKALTLGGDPKTASAWDRRGLDLWVLSRKEEALSSFRKALELDPYRVDAWMHLWGELVDRGLYQLFYDMASRVIPLFPQDALLRSSLGTACLATDRFQEALSHYDHALELDPQLHQRGELTSFSRALTLISLGRYKDALESIEQLEPSEYAWQQLRVDLAHAKTIMLLGELKAGQRELEQLLGRHPTPILIDEAANIGGFTLARSSNPETWEPFITAWLAPFATYGRLEELGRGLVYSLRQLRHSWISDETARAWHEVWQKVAGNLPEMELPLRLLSAGIEYRISHDSHALLQLAKEERGLLYPWLMNLFDEEPEISRDMQSLMRIVEQRIAEEAEAEKIRSFWKAPPPGFDQLDFPGILEDFGDRPPSLPEPLLPGGWKALERDEAVRILKVVAENDENARRAMSLPGLRIVAMDRRSLLFSRWSLYQVHVREGERIGAIDLVASSDGARILDGRSQTIFPLVTNGTIRMRSDAAKSEYTRFFCSVLRGEKGRLQIVDSVSDLRLSEGSEISDELLIKSWKRTGKSNDESGPTYAGTMLYSGALFQAEIKLSSPTQGFVEMLDDKPVASDLACAGERFNGPIRFLEAVPQPSGSNAPPQDVRS